MLLDRLKVAAVLLCLVIGGSYGAWHALASTVDGKGRANPGPAVVRAPTSSPPPRTDRYGDPLPPGAVMRLGTVRFRQFPHISHVVYSPDSQLVVTDSQEDYLQFWDARDGRKLRQVEAGMEQVRDYAFSPDGTLIAVVGCGPMPGRSRWVSQLTFLDVATGHPVRRADWEMRSGEVEMAYAPDGKTVATESEDGTLRLWDVATAKLLHQERLGGRQNLASIAFSPDARSQLLAIATERVVRLWDATHRRDVRTIAIEGEDPPTGLAFSPDGTILAAGIRTKGAEIRLWNVADGTLLKRFKNTKGTFTRQVAFSPDGKLLAAEVYQGPLMIIDVASGKVLDSFGKELDLIGDAFQGDAPMAFSPDGRTLATIGGREALHFWEPATGKDRLATPEAHQGGVYALAFPADGKTLISGSRDRTVRVWDLATGRPTRLLRHDGWVWSLAVSADGSFLAAGVAHPRAVHLWDLKTGERLHTWPLEWKVHRAYRAGCDARR